MHQLRIATAIVLWSCTAALAQQNTEIGRVPVAAISDATLSEYKGMYDTSPLCNVGEITLWTCKTSSKLYSLCSSQQVTKSSGYMQYRVSKAGRSIFIFPASRIPPIGIFSYQSYANGNASLDFTNEGYAYSLIDPLRDKSSIFVTSKNNQSRGFDILCKNGNQTLQVNYTMKLMYEAGIWQGY